MAGQLEFMGISVVQGCESSALKLISAFFVHFLCSKVKEMLQFELFFQLFSALFIGGHSHP